MKKKYFIILLCILTLQIFSSVLVFANEVEESIISIDNTELGKWEKHVEGGKANITLEVSEEHVVGEDLKSLKVSIDKSVGVSNASIKKEISDLLDVALTSYESVIGVSFNIYNEVVSNESELTVKFNYNEGDWQVEKTQIVESTYPDLTKIDDYKVTVKFSELPMGVTISDIESIEIGVSGKEDATLYLSNFTLLYSEEEEKESVKTYVDTNSSIASISFGQFQYGGVDGTTTNSSTITDLNYSKENDSTSLGVTINGTTSTEGRIFSVYFPFAAQKSLVNLYDLKGISFWVYNNVTIGGGLLFKMNEEIFNVKIFDENNVEITDNDNIRGLDYTGFRRYEIYLNSSNLTATELEIGIWGATNDTSLNISKITFVDMVQPKVGDTKINSVSAVQFNNYSTTNSMEKLTGNNTDYSYEESGAFVGINRAESVEFDISSLYFVNFKGAISDANINNPKSVSFYVYNTQVVSSGGLLFKFDSVEETTNIVWEDEDGNKGTDRNLDYVGLRKYTIQLTTDYINSQEFQLGIWGNSLATLYFSDFSIYDNSNVLEVVPKEKVLFNITSVEEFVKVEPKASLDLTVVDSKLQLNYSSTKNSVQNAYIERSFENELSTLNNVNKIEFKLSSDQAYGASGVLAISLGYADETGVISFYNAIKSVVLNDTLEHKVVLDIDSMPYFITSKNIKVIRVYIIKDSGDLKINLYDFKAVLDNTKEEKTVYSYCVSDFESEEDVAQWQLSFASGTLATISKTNNAKIGSGALSYTFSNQLYDFGWTETYIDVEQIIKANQDKNIFGLSFWLYNETYIKPGDLGFWVKLAQSDNPEYEVKFDHILCTTDTNNSLGYTGWNKIEISFNPSAYNEQNYYSGYDSSNPKYFDWTKLKYIKIGFWGTYFNNELQFSCDTRIDDLRLLSEKEIKKANRTFTITYNTNGGSLSDDVITSYTEGETLTFATPSRKGYKFVGWFDNQSLSGEVIEKITSETTGNIVLYASWEKVSYTWVYVVTPISLAVIATCLVYFIKKKRIIK